MLNVNYTTILDSISFLIVIINITIKIKYYIGRYMKQLIILNSK